MENVEEMGPSTSFVLPDEVFFAEIRRRLAAGCAVTFRIRGHSMRPFLEGGRDKVVLLPVQKFRVGDVVLARADCGNYFLHRVVAMTPAGMCLLRGDGNRGGVERCMRSDIVGVASGFWRGDVFYACRGWPWRLYSWCWGHLGPMRRGGLMFYNAGRRMRWW